MATERGDTTRCVQLEPVFDRLLAVKLEQVYRILVPEQVHIAGSVPRVKGKIDEDCRDLRQSLFQSAKREEYDCQSDCRAARIRSRTGFQRS
ncbi:hypothetical protein [Photorhabdus stackebrandtii]|uniref:hypothetical protein n=1 Tax=Photorhabdus stackebrandtii TaxID=1123042 RepID=UPI001F61DD2E|nr:hypothetical protein [Photorhabdus stackebrandtii]